MPPANPYAINFVWTLIAGFLVMFMQAGFALVETGMCRAKNAAHTMAMNFLVYSLSMTGFFICGFALMCGGANGIPPGASAAAYRWAGITGWLSELESHALCDHRRQTVGTVRPWRLLPRRTGGGPPAWPSGFST